MTGRDIVDSLPTFSRAAMLSDSALKSALPEGPIPEGVWALWWGPNGIAGREDCATTAEMAAAVRKGIMEGRQVSALRRT